MFSRRLGRVSAHVVKASDCHPHCLEQQTPASLTGSLSARCWIASRYDSRWFALISPTGRCVPSNPPLPFISKLALHFQTHHCCRDLLRNSSPRSENRTNTHSVELGNSLGLSLWFSALTHSSWSVPYVFITKLQCLHYSAVCDDGPPPCWLSIQWHLL